MDSTIAELDRRFGIPAIVKVVAGNSGLAKVRITSAAATDEMYLHGAHVASWQPRDAEEVLFVSVTGKQHLNRPIRA